MPLFYQQNINDSTKLAVWKIEETEDFFNLTPPLQKNITNPNKRLQHLAGRFLLPYLYPGFPNAEIEIATTRRPFLPNEQFHFSISHCKNWAAAIVSTSQRVGIDVELITPQLQKIKHKFLHKDELKFVETANMQEQLLYLSILWSAKEAMYKWYGLGEVNFSEMMKTSPFELQQEGGIECYFAKQDFKKNLLVHYMLFNELTLVWVAS